MAFFPFFKEENKHWKKSTMFRGQFHVNLERYQSFIPREGWIIKLLYKCDTQGSARVQVKYILSSENVHKAQ